MLTRRALLGSAAGIAATIGLAACTSSPATSTPRPAAAGGPTVAAATASGTPVKGGTLTIGIRREAAELDIHKPSSGATRQYARALHNTLTFVDVRGNARPELAESWTWPDPTTVVFKLRAGVKFHDGTACNAAAVKFNMDRILDPATRATYSGELNSVQSIDVVDDLTIRYRLKIQDITLPARLSGRAGHIVSPAAVQKWGDDYATHPVGTGPFELVEWVKDDHLTAKRFEGYWEKDERGTQLPYFDRVVYKPISDATVMFANLRSGQVDIIEGILPSDIAAVNADPNLIAVQGPGQLQVARLNLSKPPFNNKALRHAISWAIDGEAIHKGIYFGSGYPGTYLVPPENWAYDKSGKFFTRDLARARAALAEAGQPNGFKFTGLVDNITVSVQYAQAIKAQLADVGIDMTVESLAAGPHGTRRINGDYEASFVGLAPSVDPDTDVNFLLRDSPGVQQAGYENTKLNEILDRARTTTDQPTRQKAYYEAQAIVLEDAPILYVHLDADIKVMRKALQGFEPAIDAFLRSTERMWLRP